MFPRQPCCGVQQSLFCPFVPKPLPPSPLPRGMPGPPRPCSQTVHAQPQPDPCFHPQTSTQPLTGLPKCNSPTRLAHLHIFCLCVARSKNGPVPCAPGKKASVFNQREESCPPPPSWGIFKLALSEQSSREATVATAWGARAGGRPTLGRGRWTPTRPRSPRPRD